MFLAYTCAWIYKYLFIINIMFMLISFCLFVFRIRNLKKRWFQSRIYQHLEFTFPIACYIEKTRFRINTDFGRPDPHSSIYNLYCFNEGMISHSSRNSSFKYCTLYSLVIKYIYYSKCLSRFFYPQQVKFVIIEQPVKLTTHVMLEWFA